MTHQQPKHTQTHYEYLKHTHAHTQYRKIEDYIDIKQLTACTNLLAQDLSLLTNSLCVKHDCVAAAY